MHNPPYLSFFSCSKILSGSIYVTTWSSLGKGPYQITSVKTKKNMHLYLLHEATPAIKVLFFFAEKSLGGKAREHNLELVKGTTSGPLDCKMGPLAQRQDVGHSLQMCLTAITKHCSISWVITLPGHTHWCVHSISLSPSFSLSLFPCPCPPPCPSPSCYEV